MIYTLYFLYSLLIVIFTYRYLFLLRLPQILVTKEAPQEENEQLITNEMQEEIINDLNDKKELSHQDFLAVIDDLSYLHDDGICFGFILVWALDNVREKGDRFNLFIQLIRQEQHFLSKKLSEIARKIKDNEPLGKKEQQLIQLPSFIERISIAHSPEEYADIYKKKLHQTSINTIIRLIDEELETTETVERFFSKTYSFSSTSSATSYFCALEQVLNVDDNTFMLLSSNVHTVGLTKTAIGWLLLDINHLYQQSREYPHFILNNEEISKQLYKSFKQKNILCFTTDFISSNLSSDLKKRLHNFDRHHPISCKQLFSLDSELNLLSISIINGDQRTIRNIIKLNNERKLLSTQQIASAVYHAIDMNLLESLKLLIKTPGFKINMVCYDGSSPIGVAAFFGRVQVVALFLSCPGVNINFFNARKETPLMLAAGSAYTYQNTALFRLLLESGAYYHKKALAIAHQHENAAAIGVIRNFKPAHDNHAKQTLRVGNHYSLFRPAIKKEWRDYPPNNELILN